MRSLTSTQARIVQVLLADLPGAEPDRLAASGTSKSNFVSLRTRAIREGWIQYRYLPHPALFGPARVRFRIARPYAESWRSELRAAQEVDGTVLLWSTPEVLFSIVWATSSDPEDGGSVERSADAEGVFSTARTVTSDPMAGEVPVYFDFEGAWARWSRSGDPIRYPRPLVGAVDPHEWRPPNASDRHAVAQILREPYPYEQENAPGLRFSPILFRRRWRSALQNDWATLRCLPDFRRLLAYRGARIDRLVIAIGSTRPGRSAPELLVRLLHEVGAAPFLFAHDAASVVLGFVEPRPPWAPPRTVSALDLLGDHLRRIDLAVLPVHGTERIIDHDYRTLLPIERGPH